MLKNVKLYIMVKEVLMLNSLYGQPLEEVVSEKDLGVVFSNDLKVRRQCEEAYSKASQMLGLINRTIQFKNPEV